MYIVYDPVAQFKFEILFFSVFHNFYGIVAYLGSGLLRKFHVDLQLFSDMVSIGGQNWNLC